MRTGCWGCAGDSVSLSGYGYAGPGGRRGCVCGDMVGVTVEPLVGGCCAVVAAAKGVVIVVGVG
jgi:hypothetical protein